MPRVLIVSFYFPPAGGGGVQRPLKFATHLLAHGFETHVLAPNDPKWIDRDEGLGFPRGFACTGRGSSARGAAAPPRSCTACRGCSAPLGRARLLGRRLLVPDENVTWAATAIGAARRIVREEGIDVMLTTSPPGSVHLIGAAVKAIREFTGWPTFVTRSSRIRTAGSKAASFV